MNIDKVLTKVFGSSNERFLKGIRPLIAQINEFEPQVQKLSDEQLRERTAFFKAQVADAVKDARDKDDRKYREQEVLNEILPEAFALVREASVRTTGMRHFDVQMIGGLVLHQGKIAEMATGEGKTLVATMPVYLNALTGRGVHVVTVNDYLAARDGEWMGAVYQFLGLTVGCILHDQEPSVRREQYNCDITYGTNAEFGFDYLRDNGMATRLEDQVQRGHSFAIVDEVDSILIDEARVPLIISGPAVVAADSNEYDKYKPVVESLVRAQEKLCARFLSEAEELLKRLRPADGSNAPEPDLLEREIGLLLYKVKMGQPRSEGLLKLLEEPENLRLMNKAELELHVDQSKKDLYAQKEELFFAMDEKSHEAD